MKKSKTIVSVILALTIFAAIAVTSFGADVIGTAKAKAIALDHAGLTSSDVNFTKTQLDYDDGTKQYEIEFYAGAYEYEYDINAYTGRIRSYDKDYDDDRHERAVPAAPAATSNYIGIEAAKAAALKAAGVSASDAKFVTAKLDTDDGIAEYDVEFYVGNVEYDYEINAKTGKVISSDKEIENYTPAYVAPTTAASSNYIGIEAAKAAALKAAGVSASDAKFVTAELDYDDGTAHYDVEFYAGNYEYDYEIAATSGNVIASDKEIENDRPVYAPSAATEIPETAAAPKNAAPAASNELIGVEKAKEIALASAGLSASDVRFKKAQLDYDDGVAQYDIEFKVGLTKEYDYEINGTTGAITDYDFDIESVSIFTRIGNFFSRLFK